MNISGGKLVVKGLQDENITDIFGLIGYYVSPIFAACAESDINVYHTRHEQGAVHMAQGYAETTGKVGVAVLTGGPGFANSVSAIIKAQKAHAPVLVITGGFEPYKKDNGGLEDMDQLGLVKKYCKWCATVYDTKRIAEYISMAIRYALCGEKGPVVLEIPINYLLNTVDEKDVISNKGLRTNAKICGDSEKINDAIQIINEAERPVIICGSDTFYDNAEKEITRFAEVTNIPVFTVNLGRGIIPDKHNLCFGTGRTIEGGVQLFAYKNADVVIVIGSTLDYSLSFGKEPLFKNEQKFIQIDSNPCEIGLSSREINVGIIGDCDMVLKEMTERISANYDKKKKDNWVNTLSKEKEKFYSNLYKKVKEDKGIHPVNTIKAIKKVLDKEDAIIVVDGSNAMLWGCLLFECNSKGSFLIGPDSNYGQMGTGLPLAIGAKIANPHKKVILYTGDGSLGFNLSEINTAIRFNIDITIIVHNDSTWGFCKETQRVVFGEENCGYGTELGFTRYDEIVNAFGGYGQLVEESSQLEEVISRAVDSKKISCVNVVTDGIMSPGANFLNGTV